MKMKEWKELLIKNVQAIPDDSDYANVDADYDWETKHREYKVLFGRNEGKK